MCKYPFVYEVGLICATISRLLNQMILCVMLSYILLL